MNVLDTVRTALGFELCPVPCALDGSKRPFGQWKEFQSHRPTREQVEQWFGGGHPGWGLICGSVSGNIEMLELEGRAVELGMLDEFRKRCAESGVGDVVESMIAGYCERTPSGGVHILFAVGNGACLGNTKLARQENGDVLIETRGQGGFVVLAPSNGPTHPSGKPWEMISGTLATIVIVKAAERDAVYAVARSFDLVKPKTTAPKPPKTTTAPANRMPLSHAAAHADSWLDALCVEIDRRSWSDVLGSYGFAEHHVADDITYWTRPGKDPAIGYSATTNALGTDRLISFSSSLPFDEWDGSSAASSYDRLDVIAAYEFGGDRVAAARALAGRDEPSISHLDPTFWAERDAFAHVRIAAHARSVSADAVLAVVLARIAAFTPPSYVLPPIVGGYASLNMFSAIVGGSGVGKTAAKAVACDLVLCEFESIADDVPLGSGEGLVELYFDHINEADSNGKSRQVKRQVRYGAFVSLDEGQALNELNARKGSTIGPTLRSAWSGAVLGSSNASSETKRRLRALSYSLGLSIGFQPEKAGDLLADAVGGTPQRFIWASATDPSLPDHAPEWPGPLDWSPMPVIGGFAQREHSVIAVHPEIASEIRRQALAVSRGVVQLEALDEHAQLVRLKVAALFGVLDGRRSVDLDDWRLAGVFMTTSNAVRGAVASAVATQQRHAEKATIARQIGRDTAIADDQRQRALVNMSRAIARHVHRAQCDAACSTRCVSRATASQDRALVPIADAVEYAISMHWIGRNGSTFTPGSARPT